MMLTGESMEERFIQKDVDWLLPDLLCLLYGRGLSGFRIILAYGQTMGVDY
jgi:hypothetical protein